MAEKKEQTGEEKEATRIAKILTGLKQAGTNVKKSVTSPGAREAAKRVATTTGKTAIGAAETVGKGLKTTGRVTARAGGAVRRGAGATGRFIASDLRQTKEDIKGAGRWTWAAGGAAAGYAARGLGAADRGLQAATSNPWPFFIAAVAVYLYELITNFYSYTYLRLLAYLGLALWAWLIFYKQQGGFESVKTPLLISALAFSAPLLVGLIIMILGRFHVVLPMTTELWLDGLVMYLFAPVWIYAMLLFPPVETDKLMRALGAVLILGLLLVGLFAVRPSLADMDAYRTAIPTDVIYQKTKNFLAEGVKKTIVAVREIPAQLREGGKKQLTRYMDYATGGAYTENVNTEKIDTWVVEVQEAYPWKEEYKPGEDVTVEAVFAGNRKEGEKTYVTGLNVLNFGCRTKEKEGVSSTSGEVSPNSTYLVKILGGEYSDTGKQSVICSLPPLSESKSVDIYSSFDYSARSELLVLFTTPDRKTSLVHSQKISQYELKPLAEPVGTGPVTIAMEFEESYPVMVQPGSTTSIKVTVEDHDELYGRINKLSEFKLNLPEGMKLASCRARKEKTTVSLTIKEDGTVDTSPIDFPVDDYVAFKCDIAFTQEVLSLFDAEMANEKKDIISKKITASAKYNYELARSIRVNVAESSGGGGTTGGGGEFVGDENLLVTETTATEEQVKKYLEKNAGSKLKDQGNLFYNLGNQYGVDPAFAVAVAMHESAKGTSNLAVNCNNFFGHTGDGCGRFKKFLTPTESIEAFYKNIKENYLPKGQDTPKKMVAPKLCGVSNNKDYFCCNLNPTHCYCCDGDSADWLKSVTSIRAAVSGRSNVPSYSGNCAKVIDYARDYLGTGYGGTGACSAEMAQAGRCTTQCGSFITNAYSHFNIPAAGDGNEKCKRANAIKITKSELKAGDIISITEGVGHSALYIADGKIIHSTRAPPAGSTPHINEGVVISDLDKILVDANGNLRSVEYCRLEQCT